MSAHVSRAQYNLYIEALRIRAAQDREDARAAKETTEQARARRDEVYRMIKQGARMQEIEK